MKTNRKYLYNCYFFYSQYFFTFNLVLPIEITLNLLNAERLVSSLLHLLCIQVLFLMYLVRRSFDQIQTNHLQDKIAMI